ncbi:MAG TPA: FAD-binding and (Fe-S)-binding domain-containing protein, partial [Myxococcota bacterium]|nr:FAD-binding and (Fe-S)-binding domain-containing protein [Myxococcota bacterium]
MSAAIGGPSLERELAEHLDGEVRFDDGARALYATDASNYRQVPIGVVLPRHAGDVERAVAICDAHDAAILPRGGGTSLAGQCCNVAVVLDFSRHMNRVLEIDPEARTARVEPGCVLDHLLRAAAPHGLTFGPDPSTASRCTLGGMIGNDSCGVHSVMAGRTADNVESLEVLTADGARMRLGATGEAQLAEIRRRGGREAAIVRRLLHLRREYGDEVRARFPRIPRRVSGYNLDELLPERGLHLARALVGSEGTCATLLEATVRLVPDPPARALAVLGFPDVFAAAEAVPAVLEHEPIGLEGLDDVLAGNLRDKRIHPEALERLPDGGGWLLVELGADTDDEAVARAKEVRERIEKECSGARGEIVADAREQETLWSVRRAALGATAFVEGQPDTWPGFEDSAVAPERLGAYLRALRGLLDRYGYVGALYGHFGDGCVHTRISFDPGSERGRARMREFLYEAADLVVAHGGSLSGEHGDGQARAELLERMFGARLVEAFAEFKSAWDPANRMNPGKVVDPEPLDAHMRLEGAFAHEAESTHFRYPRDHGSFTRATLRCVGVGLCRRTEGGTMCPSYKVTREEAHSTRGRAHLLAEMLRDGPLRDGWRDDAVKEALDLCLACKGCLGDCPVDVDVATH